MERVGLGPQLWFGRHRKGYRPRGDYIQKPRLRPGWGVKPVGGMWTSSEGDPENWIQWCRGEQPDWINRVRPWRLIPRPDVRIYEIDTADDLELLWKRFPRDPAADDPRLDIFRSHYRWVDWLAVGEFYDGIHLTGRGQWATRFGNLWMETETGELDVATLLQRIPMPELSLYGWDCESTWWPRWVFGGRWDAVELPTIRVYGRSVRDEVRRRRRFRRDLIYWRETGRIPWQVSEESSTPEAVEVTGQTAPTDLAE